MALEPVEISSVSDRTEYTCPMHPEIVRDQPGNCPICGMALEPRDVLVDSANPELANMTRRFCSAWPLASASPDGTVARMAGACACDASGLMGWLAVL
jgi:Cu+-exporting ATPase